MALPAGSTNVIPFPTISSRNPSRSQTSNMSILSTTRATAIDVCYSVYGEQPTSDDAVDRFYEPNAGDVSVPILIQCQDLTGCDPSYENPFITATSRSVIGDIHRISKQFSSVDIPRPLAAFCTLFRIRPTHLGQNSSDPLFQALRVWTDVGDICENESFDGHRKAVVEHTLNVLLLPGIHRDGFLSHRSNSSSESLVNIAGPSFSLLHPPHPFDQPALHIPGTSLSLPSPLHFKLRIMTCLSFNEQGLVTHHRDNWDVRDIMGLVPGLSLAQWIGTRLAAAGLSYASRLLGKPKPQCYAKGSAESTRASLTGSLDLESGTAAKAPSEKGNSRADTI